MHLAEYFKDRDSIKTALGFVNKALAISNFTKNVTYKKSALSMKIELQLYGDKEFEVLKNINDSINHSLILSQNKYISEKYNYDKANDELRLNKVKRGRDQIIFTVGILFLLSVFALGYFLIQSKHKKEKLQQVYNTETRISKKVHDEVANDVFQIMTSLQRNSNRNEKIIDDLDQIYNKTRDISKQHAILDYDTNFEQALNDLLLSYNINTVNVIAKDISKINWESISKIKKNTIYKVLQELMINMTKHSKASVSVLTFNQNKKKVEIHYNDNGVGCNLKKHTGLQNVENRIESINGTISFDSEINNGFKAKITV